MAGAPPQCPPACRDARRPCPANSSTRTSWSSPLATGSRPMRPGRHRSDAPRRASRSASSSSCAEPCRRCGSLASARSMASASRTGTRRFTCRTDGGDQERIALGELGGDAPAKRPRAGDGLVEQRAGREDVAGGGRPLPGNLLWSLVGVDIGDRRPGRGRGDVHGGRGEGAEPGRRSTTDRATALPEPEQLHVPVRGDAEIGGPHLSVHQASPMHCTERARELDRRAR